MWEKKHDLKVSLFWLNLIKFEISLLHADINLTFWSLRCESKEFVRSCNRQLRQASMIIKELY